MGDLFGDPLPLRIVLHVNMYRGGGRFDWDGMAQVPETGDLVAMTASPGRLRHNLGPELSRMLLWTHSTVLRAEEPPSVDLDDGSSVTLGRVPVEDPTAP